MQIMLSNHELEKQHSILAPSASERWHNCPGSVQLIAQCPPAEPSKYAEQGTAAHMVAAQILNGVNVVSGKIVTEAGFEFIISQNEDKDDTVCLDHIYMYTEYVNGLIEQYNLQPNQIKIEQKIKLRGQDADGGERFGTVDFAAFIPGVGLYIVDFKYGAGVGVDAESSLQCRDYAVGFWDMLTPEKRALIPLLKVVIVQPRGGFAGIKEATFLQAAIEMHGDDIDAAIMRVFQNPQVVAGPWCKNTFCPAKAHCEVARAYAEESTGVKYDMILAEDQTLPLIRPAEATNEQIAFFCEREDFVINWFAEMRKEGYRRFKNGQPIARHKIVEKNTHRKFTDEDKVKTMFAPDLGERIFTEPKLISPNQLEQLWRRETKCTVKEAKELLDELTYKPTGDHVLVPESDKRPAVATDGEAYQQIIDAKVGE